MSISVALSYWNNTHFEELGHPYCTCYGKDQKILKDLGATYGTPKLIKLMDLFFKRMKTDPFLQKTGATIGVFRTQVPKLLLELPNINTKLGKL